MKENKECTNKEHWKKTKAIERKIKKKRGNCEN